MIITLEEVTTLAVLHFMLIFCRVGAAMMTMPGFGEVFVPPTARLYIALMISFVLTPVLSPTLPGMPEGFMTLLLLIGNEILIGAFIGALARILQSVMHTAGVIMAFLSSLAAAQLFDTTQGAQGSVFGNFLTIAALALMFAADLHHLLLQGLTDSYALFTPGNFIPAEDFSIIGPMLLSGAFLTAIKIAAPQIIVGLSLYLASGLMARLMPQMQVFFILIPIQVMVSFNVLLITFAAGMMWYIKHFEESMTSILYP